MSEVAELKKMLANLPLSPAEKQAYRNRIRVLKAAKLDKERRD